MKVQTKQKIYTTKEVSDLLEDPENRQKILHVAVFNQQSSVLDINQLKYINHKKGKSPNRRNSSTSSNFNIDKINNYSNQKTQNSKRNSITTINMYQNMNNSQISTPQNILDQQSPKIKKELNKISTEFEEYKQRQIEKDIRYNLIEENYFPFVKYPPDPHLSPNPNYKVIFIFKIEKLEFLFIKRFDLLFNVSFFWARKEDALKYGIEYNDLHIPGLFYECMENFTTYSEIKKSCSVLQNKINEQAKIISGYNVKIDQLKNENASLKSCVHLKTQKELGYEKELKNFTFENEKLNEHLEIMDKKINELTKENEDLKQNLDEITMKYNNNKVFYDLNNTVNLLPQLIKEQVGKISTKHFYTLKTQKINNIDIIAEEKQEKDKENKTIHENVIKELQEEYNNKLKQILIKVKKELENKEEELNYKISIMQTEKDDIISNLESEIHTLKLENQNSKQLVTDLKYLIEIKESETKRLSEYENEVSNLKNQIKELKNYNEHYNNLINEKENLLEESENKLKGLIIKLKEKDNQIEDYSRKIDQLQNLAFSTEKNKNEFDENMSDEQYENNSEDNNDD